MAPEERKQRFDEIADRLFTALEQLGIMSNELHYQCDRIALDRVLTDLIWAVENCRVIGQHQVGEAMDDNMGIFHDGGVR